MASSPNECVPEFTVLPGSFKCCNGRVKNMKLVVQVTDINGCLDAGSDTICVSDIALGNGQDIGQVVFDGSECVTEGGTFTVFLLDTDSCTVNLLVTFSVAGGPAQVAELQSGNIPSGNTAGDCVPD